MKLYTSQRGSNPMRVRIFLAEKGIDVPIVEIDIGAGQNRTPEFAKINWFKAVPVLELDDGTIITESIAICRYFEEVQLDPPLFGVGPVERALVEMWNRRVELEVVGRIAGAFRHGSEFFKGRITQVPPYAAACRDEIPKMLDWLDGEMSDRPFVAGERFSVADITLYAGLGLMKRGLDIDLSNSQKNLLRWRDAVAERPSIKQ